MKVSELPLHQAVCILLYFRWKTCVLSCIVVNWHWQYAKNMFHSMSDVTKCCAWGNLRRFPRDHYLLALQRTHSSTMKATEDGSSDLCGPPWYFKSKTLPSIKRAWEPLPYGTILATPLLKLPRSAVRCCQGQLLPFLDATLKFKPCNDALWILRIRLHMPFKSHVSYAYYGLVLVSRCHEIEYLPYKSIPLAKWSIRFNLHFWLF